VGIKILSAIFALVALRRVIARYRRRGGLTLELMLWIFIFSGIGLAAFIPEVTNSFAHWLGVASGFNALAFIAITGLIYAVFRLVSRLTTVERDVTMLVRTLALSTAARVPPRPPSERPTQ
jgi:hypothetical protein